MANEILSGVISLVVTVLGAIITTVLLPAAASWLKSKTASEKLKSVIDDITITVKTSVEMLEQTTVKQLKADGKWNADAQAQVLQDAVTQVLNGLTTSTYNYLKEESDDLEGIVTRHIEAYIQSKKADN